MKPYALLAEAMERAEKVGIARFVMRSKQYLAAVRPSDGKLVLSTMVYDDEVNDVDDIPELEAAASRSSSPTRSWRWPRSSSSRSRAEFEPEKFHDTYREQVLELIERKAAGEAGGRRRPVAAGGQTRSSTSWPPSEASVAAAKESRERHPTARAAERVGRGRRAGARSPPPKRAAKTGAGRAARPDREPPRLDAPGSEKTDDPRSTGGGSSCPTSTRSSTPRSGSPRPRSSTTTSASPPTMLRARRRPGRHPAALPERRRRQVVLREALPLAPARLGRTSPSAPATARAASTTAGSTTVAALVWAANMAALEIHAPMARADDIETPTMVVFDLDPGAPGRRSSSAAEVALRDPRRAARASTSQPFPKTSRLEGPAALPAAQHARTPTSTPASFALRRGPAAREAATRRR